MAVEDAIWALHEHWADVMARLDAGARQELGRLLDDLAGPDRARASAQIADLLVEELPPGHPVRRALVGGTLFAPADVDWPSLTRALRDRAAATDLRLDQPMPTGWVLRNVEDRLLSVAALNEQEVRGLGLDPADPDLIRLRRAAGGHQWPAFQFGSDGSLPELVRSINRLLGAHDDPIGVADWWLSRNGWLGEAPHSLIGRVPDDRLVQAARAVATEA